MADKYESKWVEGGAVEVIIPSGPAAGTYTVRAPRVEGGMIVIAARAMVSGIARCLKVKADEMPKLAAEITEYHAALEAKAAKEAATESEEERVLREMRAAGFESDSPAYDRQFGFDGRKF